jgi:hypothetical protein
MTEAAAVTSPQPGAVPPPAPLSPDAFSRVDISDQHKYSQVKRADGNGSEWVLRDSLPADTPPNSQSGRPRPAWVPESAWDPTLGLNHEKFGEWYRETVAPAIAAHEAEEARRKTLPASPDKYEVKTSPALKLPDDTKPELNPADPMWEQAKAWAHKAGLSQAAFEQAVDLVAARDTLTARQINTAREREIAKLGPGAKVRMDAIEAFYRDWLGPDDAAGVTARIWTAADVVRAEKAVARFKGQGISLERRGPGISDDEWARMDARARYAHAKAHSGAPR